MSVISRNVIQKKELSYFIVLGVPHSGADFFTRILSAHPSISCRVEPSRPQCSSLDLLTVDSFIHAHLEHISSVVNSNEVTAKRDGELLAVGDKLLQSYLHLDKVYSEGNRATIDLKKIVIFRAMQHVELSWFVQASNVDDNTWHEGKFGAIPYIEMVILVWQLITVKDPLNYLVLTYENLVSTEHREVTLEALTDFLTIDEVSTLLETLKNEIDKSVRTRQKASIEHISEFKTNSSFFDEVTTLLNQNKLCSLSSIQDELSEIFWRMVKQNTFFEDVLTYFRADVALNQSGFVGG